MSRYHRLPTDTTTQPLRARCHEQWAAREARTAKRREAKRLAGVFLCSFAELCGVLLIMYSIIMLAVGLAPERCCQVGLDGYGVSATVEVGQ